MPIFDICCHCKTSRFHHGAFSRCPNGRTQFEALEHGVNCEKVEHDPKRTGYLHAADDDRSYDVDGVEYCGRCHVALNGQYQVLR